MRTPFPVWPLKESGEKLRAGPMREKGLRITLMWFRLRHGAEADDSGGRKGRFHGGVGVGVSSNRVKF